MPCSKMVPEWLIIDFIPKIEILFQNMSLEITFSEFLSDGHFLGIEGITRIDFWIFFPKLMIWNKNKNWKKMGYDSEFSKNFPQSESEIRKLKKNLEICFAK